MKILAWYELQIQSILNGLFKGQDTEIGDNFLWQCCHLFTSFTLLHNIIPSSHDFPSVNVSLSLFLVSSLASVWLNVCACPVFADRSDGEYSLGLFQRHLHSKILKFSLKMWRYYTIFFQSVNLYCLLYEFNTNKFLDIGKRVRNLLYIIRMCWDIFILFSWLDPW